MIVPPEKLDPSTLRSLLESFIHREGTDYGDRELDLREKLQNLQTQLARGEVVIVYDEASCSVNILRRAQYQALNIHGES